MTAQPATQLSHHLRVSVWRIVVWLLLLLAVLGILLYSTHGWHVVTTLRGGGDDGHAQFAHMLAWDAAYLVGACITVAAAAGTLLWRAWARPVLRVVCALLALWLLVTVVVLVVHWIGFTHDAGALLAQPHVGDAARALAARVQHRFLVQTVLKAVCVPILAWLVWRLGVPSVRARFASAPWRRTR